MVRASASGAAVHSGFIPNRVKPMNLKLLLTASLPDAHNLSKLLWRASRLLYLMRRWERHLAGFPHLGVVERWPVTPNRARYSALIAFS